MVVLVVMLLMVVMAVKVIVLVAVLGVTVRSLMVMVFEEFWASRCTPS